MKTVGYLTFLAGCVAWAAATGIHTPEMTLGIFVSTLGWWVEVTRR